MTTPPDKPNRWRPRFSVRTLVIVVTLVCVYAACWGVTKRQGVLDVVSNHSVFETVSVRRSLAQLRNGSSPMPFVVGADDNEFPRGARRYYFWFFGYVAKLPFEREID